MPTKNKTGISHDNKLERNVFSTVPVNWAPDFSICSARAGGSTRLVMNSSRPLIGSLSRPLICSWWTVSSTIFFSSSSFRNWL